MAIKTFTTGEVLTASDTNTYLANSGLDFIKQQTVGSGVTSVIVTSAFSSTYDNYRITVAGITPSAADSFCLMIGSSRTTGHYGAMNYMLYSVSGGTIGSTNSSKILCTLNQNSVNNAQFNCDIFSPFLATRTGMVGQGFGRLYYCDFGGADDSIASYTSFTLLTDGAGTMTGGTITVYGYRKQ
jgi:hypothetical protein